MEQASPDGTGSWLRQRRTQALLTQEELASLAGLNARTIREIERGRIARPRAATMRILMAALARIEQVSPGPVGAAGVKPQELPPPRYAFVGRMAEVTELNRFLVTAPSVRAPVMSVAGVAGVGKSMLAVHWAHLVRHRFPDGQLYMDLHGYDCPQPTLPTDALAAFLRGFGLQDGEMPADVDERAARYRSLTAGRRVLVVLDNARSTEQVETLLPAASGCAVIVTSREPLPELAVQYGAVGLELDLLPDVDAVHLLRQTIGERVVQDPAAASAIARSCDYLPLTLRVAAEYAAGRPDEPLTVVARELAALNHRPAGPGSARQTAGSLRAVLSWSVSHLPAPARETFTLLGLHPDRDFDTHAAAALCGCGTDEVRTRLAQLVDARLLDEFRPGRYAFHDLMRNYAKDLAGCLGEEAHQPRERLFRFYEFTAAAAMTIVYPEERHHRPPIAHPDTPTLHFDSTLAASSWLDQERANLIMVGELATDTHPRITCSLSTLLWRYLANGVFHTEAAVLHEAALTASDGVGDQAGKARALTNLAAARWSLGRPHEAAQLLEEAVRVAQCSDDRVGEARAQNHLSGMYWFLGRLADGVKHYEITLSLRDEVKYEPLEHFVYPNLAAPFERYGRTAESIGPLQRALALARRSRDAVAAGYALCVLAVTHRLRGQLEDARAYAIQAQKESRNLGYRLNEVPALNELGLICVRTGDVQDALRHLSVGLTLSRDTLDRSNEGYALLYQAEAYLRYRRYETAAASAEDALAIGRATHDGDLEAKAHNMLGLCCDGEGAALEAIGYHSTAMDLAVRKGNVLEQACAHLGLSTAHRSLGNHVPSAAHLRTGTSALRELDVQAPWWAPAC